MITAYQCVYISPLRQRLTTHYVGFVCIRDCVSNVQELQTTTGRCTEKSEFYCYGTIH